jgi:AraC-like DNA-binding protein
MLIEEIDHVGLEPLQSRVSYGSDSLRLAVRSLTWHSILETELGRDDYLVANRCQRFANHLFVRKRTICLSNSVLELNEAAYMLGFEDPNSFGRAFRAWEGVPPSDWREAHRTSTVM